MAAMTGRVSFKEVFREVNSPKKKSARVVCHEVLD
jgi:hypothetical protein